MKTNLTNWLCGLCAILLIAVLVFQFKQQGRLDALQRQQQEQRDTSAKLSAQANITSIAIQQQTAVLHRALGKVIPIELPDALTKKLGALEAHIADEKSWPNDAAETDRTLAELRDLVGQIPPWAEEDILPRLNALRWGLSGLTLVARSQTVANDGLADFLDSVDTALEAKPDGASELIANKLAGVQGKVKAQFDSFRRDNTVADAERLIRDGGAIAGFSEIQGRLSEWAAVPEFKERIETLQHDVKARSLLDDTAKFAASVDKGLLRISSEPSVVVRQISLGKLLDSVVSERQMLAESQDAPESLDRKLAELSAQIEKAIEAESKTQTAEQDKKLRNYQSWALSEIAKFKQQLEIRTTGFNDKIGIQDDLVRFLLPISSGYLDPAVARIYQSTFDEAWGLIDSGHQIYVGKLEVVVEKRKP